MEHNNQFIMVWKSVTIDEVTVEELFFLSGGLFPHPYLTWSGCARKLYANEVSFASTIHQLLNVLSAWQVYRRAFSLYILSI